MTSEKVPWSHVLWHILTVNLLNYYWINYYNYKTIILKFLIKLVLLPIVFSGMLLNEFEPVLLGEEHESVHRSFRLVRIVVLLLLLGRRRRRGHLWRRHCWRDCDQPWYGSGQGWKGVFWKCVGILIEITV